MLDDVYSSFTVTDTNPGVTYGKCYLAGNQITIVNSVANGNI